MSCSVNIMPLGQRKPIATARICAFPFPVNRHERRQGQLSRQLPVNQSRPHLTNRLHSPIECGRYSCVLCESGPCAGLFPVWNLWAADTRLWVFRLRACVCECSVCGCVCEYSVFGRVLSSVPSVGVSVSVPSAGVCLWVFRLRADACEFHASPGIRPEFLCGCMPLARLRPGCSASALCLFVSARPRAWPVRRRHWSVQPTEAPPARRDRVCRPLCRPGAGGWLEW